MVFIDGTRQKVLKGREDSGKRYYAASFRDGHRGAEQSVIDGVLFTTFPDDEEMDVKAGMIICQPWTEEDSTNSHPEDDVLGATVSSYDANGVSIMFHDIGVFIPDYTPDFITDGL